MIRVLVVEDSALMRRMIRGIMCAAPDMEVVDTARDGKAATLPFDSVILCVGQEPVRELADSLNYAAPALPVHVIGGADRAAELDAKRAIEQAYRLALEI